jgi:arginase family enzyme
VPVVPANAPRTVDLVAMDVCEVAPAYDNGESAMAACQVIVDTLAAYADSHR